MTSAVSWRHYGHSDCEDLGKRKQKHIVQQVKRLNLSELCVYVCCNVKLCWCGSCGCCVIWILNCFSSSHIVQSANSLIFILISDLFWLFIIWHLQIWVVHHHLLASPPLSPGRYSRKYVQQTVTDQLTTRMFWSRTLQNIRVFILSTPTSVGKESIQQCSFEIRIHHGMKCWPWYLWTAFHYFWIIR